MSEVFFSKQSQWQESACGHFFQTRNPNRCWQRFGILRSSQRKIKRTPSLICSELLTWERSASASVFSGKADSISEAQLFLQWQLRAKFAFSKIKRIKAFFTMKPIILQGIKHNGLLRTFIQHPKPVRRHVSQLFHRTNGGDSIGTGNIDLDLQVCFAVSFAKSRHTQGDYSCTWN